MNHVEILVRLAVPVLLTAWTVYLDSISGIVILILVLCVILLVILVAQMVMTVSAVSKERISMETFVLIPVVIYTHKTAFVLL